MIKALSEIEVITVFAEDLAATKAFYRDVFGLEVVYQDDESAVFQLKNVMLNVLVASEATDLLEPASLAAPGSGARTLLTINVKDAEAVCAELEQHGVKLINGPIDRPWGRRTASFADPAGNIWEIAQELPQA